MCFQPCVEDASHHRFFWEVFMAVKRDGGTVDCMRVIIFCLDHQVSSAPPTPSAVQTIRKYAYM